MQPELDAATATISAILHQVTALTRRVDPDAEARQLVAPDEVVGGPRRGSFDRPLRQLDPAICLPPKICRKHYGSTRKQMREGYRNGWPYRMPDNMLT